MIFTINFKYFVDFMQYFLTHKFDMIMHLYI